MVNTVKNAGDEGKSNPTIKLSAPARQDIVDWVDRGYIFLYENKDIIKCSFNVCGITTTNPELIQNDNFLKSILGKIDIESDKDDDVDTFNDLFKDKKKNSGPLLHFC